MIYLSEPTRNKTGRGIISDCLQDTIENAYLSTGSELLINASRFHYAIGSVPDTALVRNCESKTGLWAFPLLMLSAFDVYTSGFI